MRSKLIKLRNLFHRWSATDQETRDTIKEADSIDSALEWGAKYDKAVIDEILREE